jgi:hypothetical protein
MTGTAPKVPLRTSHRHLKLGDQITSNCFGWADEIFHGWRDDWTEGTASKSARLGKWADEANAKILISMLYTTACQGLIIDILLTSIIIY